MHLELQSGCTFLLDTFHNFAPFIQIVNIQLILIDLLCAGQYSRHGDGEVDK